MSKLTNTERSFEVMFHQFEIDLSTTVKIMHRNRTQISLIIPDMVRKWVPCVLDKRYFIILVLRL
jgi:hypothetical protein